jgi:hypothetical protein
MCSDVNDGEPILGVLKRPDESDGDDEGRYFGWSSTLVAETT